MNEKMNNRKSVQRTVDLALLVLLLSACGALLSAPTPTAIPSPTPIPVPLSEIDLEPILVLPGDLPAGFAGAQVRDSLPRMFEGLPEPENQIYQQFERREDVAGGVVVMLYDLSSDLDTAYSLIVKDFGKPGNKGGITTERETVSDVGERAEALTIEGTLLGRTLNCVDLAFVRCNAVVHIRLMGTAYLDDITSYAKRLDKRLADIVCR